MSRNPSTNIAVSGQIVPASVEKPANRKFRDAWELDPSKPAIRVNMTKARELKRAMLRQERMPRLVELDHQQMTAIVAGDTAEAARLETIKQKLRDLPQHPRLEQVTGPEELEKLALEELTDAVPDRPLR